MNKINQDFDIPYYIFEELTEYIELTAKGYSKSMKWANIRKLIKLSVINNKLSEEQADFLISRYTREKEIIKN